MASQTNTTGRVFGAVGAVLVMAVNAQLAHRVGPVLESTAGLTRGEQERIDHAASASLLGQFRSSMADFLWLKTDKYLHGGVDLRGKTEQEQKKAQADEVLSAEKDGHRQHDGSETTVIPSARNDWRGRIGAIERQVTPYQDMGAHKHREAKEALPLFRLMVVSNPKFVSAYVTGASLLAGEKRLDEALAFLREGEKNNPESIEIASALGYHLTAHKRDFNGAVTYLNRALVLSQARDSSTLTEDEREAWREAVRWTVLNRREAGDKENAVKIAKAGLVWFPNDVVCRNYLKGVENRK